MVCVPTNSIVGTHAGPAFVWRRKRDLFNFQINARGRKKPGLFCLGTTHTVTRFYLDTRFHIHNDKTRRTHNRHVRGILPAPTPTVNKYFNPVLWCIHGTFDTRKYVGKI